MKDNTHMNNEASMQSAPPRPSWLLPAVAAGVVALVAIVGLILFVGGDDDGDDVSTPAGTATSVADPGGTTAPATPGSGSSVGPDDTALSGAGDPATLAEGDLLTIERNSTYFPWLYPLPDVSWFTEGCPEPETVASDFIAAITGGPALAGDAIVRQSESATRMELLVDLPNGDGGSTGSVTVTMAQVTVGNLDCEAWGVLEVQAPGQMTLDSPTNDDSVGLSAFVSGTSQGFEAGIEMELIDQRFEVVGAAPGLAGLELAPFGGEVVFEEPPIDENVMVIARSSLPLDNAIAPFAAVKVRFDPLSSVDPNPPASGDPDLPRVLGPVAVIGVAFDDELNARSGGGVENDIVGTISPFEVGITQYDALVSFVGGDTWVPVGNPESRDLDAWVNDRFVRIVEGDEVQSDAFYRALTLHRQGLSLGVGDGLTDLVADGTVTVSSNAFFSGDEQVLTSADFANAGGEDDVLRTWGEQDGTGDPIELTVGEMLDLIASSKGLIATERVAINERIKFGNTIDNMAEAFPDATIVELHYGGDEGDQADFTWATVRLGFEPDGNGYRLVAIALDNWTV